HGFASTVPSGASPAFARKRLTVLKGGLDLLRAKWLIITLRPTEAARRSGGCRKLGKNVPD
ncbi:hypothetical protein QZN22_30365, partial [Burkholderia vietnamiensis]|uniref:hypothetical protein n=1 Tax=Burkholderia vietnamiensis TaxID=60552 RepID=UPI00264B5661